MALAIYWPSPLSLAASILISGFVVAQFQAMRVDAPILERELRFADVEMWIEDVETRPDGSRRIYGVPVTIEGLEPSVLPKRIRLSLRGADKAPIPGDWVSVLASLRPPPPPIAPNAYDFGFHAWFAQIGAIGFVVGDLELIESRRQISTFERWATALATARRTTADYVRDKIEGATGGVAAALMIGDRGGIPSEVTENLRIAGLAHLLAISGLHVGMFTFSFFFAVRFLLSCFPKIALQFPIKKWAAVIAWMGALVYLLFSGMAIPTQRAFIMVSVVFGAILLERPAFTLRSVAVAAIAILIVSPQSLMHVGFQMSFSAIIALVAFYEAVRHHPTIKSSRHEGVVRRSFKYLYGVVLSSIIATAAIAPIAAFHFNRVADYGLAANVVAMPVMGFVIMPSILLSYVLLPFGLEDISFAPLAFGIDIVLWVAAEVASWPSSQFHNASFSSTCLILITLGGLWLCIWRTRWRWLGIVPLCAGIAFGHLTPAPIAFISHDGSSIGVVNNSGTLVMIKGRRDSFAADIWSRRLGLNPTETITYRSTSDPSCDSLGCVMRVADNDMLAISFHPASLRDDCRVATVLIALYPIKGRCREPAHIVDRFDFWRDGSHALYRTEVGSRNAFRIETVGASHVTRPWHAN